MIRRLLCLLKFHNLRIVRVNTVKWDNSDCSRIIRACVYCDFVCLERIFGLVTKEEIEGLA